MAVYTHVPAEEMAAFLTRYDTGALVSAKGIAEGVENSNYMLETRRADGSSERFILTLYEKRVDEADLPFFMDLLDYVGARGCKVPRFIADTARIASPRLAWPCPQRPSRQALSRWIWLSTKPDSTSLPPRSTSTPSQARRGSIARMRPAAIPISTGVGEDRVLALRKIWSNAVAVLMDFNRARGD